MTPDQKLRLVNEALFLMWSLLLVLSVLFWDRRPTGNLPWKTKPKTEFCKLHSRPLTECRHMHDKL